MQQHLIMNQTQTINNLIDPFKGQSILSLNPRTFRGSKDALKSNDIESIHHFMRSMELQNSDKYLEEARKVVDGGSEFLNTKEIKATTKENENPQEQRPALLRKRARFSLKLDISEPSKILEPSLQIDQVQDPEDFFAAFEKFENTKKELKRQIGGEALNDAKISTTARQRRPEIPRRITSYKHHEYSSQPESDVSFAQEILQNKIGSPPAYYSQPESVTLNCESQEEEVAESVARTEDRVNDLFTDLIDTCGNLDEKRTMSLLKDRLNIKLADIDNLQLPDYHNIPRVDFPSFKNILENHSLLSDTRPSSDSLRGKTPRKQIQLSDNPFSPLASPTPPKSPFMAISSFGKHISKLSERKDPFSSHDIDALHTTTSETMSEQSTHASKDKEFSVSAALDSLVKNKATDTATNNVAQEVSAEDVINPPDFDNLSEQCHTMEETDEDDNVASATVITDIQTTEGIRGNAEDMVQKAASGTKVNLNIEDITDNLYSDSVQEMEENDKDGTEKAGSHASPEVDVEISTIEDLSSHCLQSAQADTNIVEALDEIIPAQNPDLVSEQNEEQPKTYVKKRKKTIRAPKADRKKRNQSLAAQIDTNTIEDLDESRPGQIPDVVYEQQNEEQPNTSVEERKKTTRATKIDLNKRHQSVAAQTDANTIEDLDSSRPAQIPDVVSEQQIETARESKVDLRNRRQSLADAGTSWTGGVRRSNRIKRRPLEYWKGERLLYGRVHNSLPTIIGVKYISPSKGDGKHYCFRVESFVSAKYKDLVDQTSLH